MNDFPPPASRFQKDEAVEVHDGNIHWYGHIKSMKWMPGVAEYYYVVENQISGETVVRREANLVKA